MPPFHEKDAVLLKCKDIPVKIGLRYTLTSNSLSQIVISLLKNSSEGLEAKFQRGRAQSKT